MGAYGVLPPTSLPCAAGEASKRSDAVLSLMFSDDGPGPRTHALLIGVGGYQECLRLATEDSSRGALARRFVPLRSPARSATAVVSCAPLQQDNPVAPLGSIELLTSSDGNVTLAAVSGAFRQWYERCDRDKDNVALFYFSGHGVSRGKSTRCCSMTSDRITCDSSATPSIWSTQCAAWPGAQRLHSASSSTPVGTCLTRCWIRRSSTLSRW